MGYFVLLFYSRGIRKIIFGDSLEFQIPMLLGRFESDHLFMRILESKNIAFVPQGLEKKVGDFSLNYPNDTRIKDKEIYTELVGW